MVVSSFESVSSSNSVNLETARTGGIILVAFGTVFTLGLMVWIGCSIYDGCRRKKGLLKRSQLLN